MAAYRYGGTRVLNRVLFNPYCTPELIEEFLFGRKTSPEDWRSFQTESATPTVFSQESFSAEMELEIAALLPVGDSAFSSRDEEIELIHETVEGADNTERPIEDTVNVVSEPVTEVPVADAHEETVDLEPIPDSPPAISKIDSDALAIPGFVKEIVEEIVENAMTESEENLSSLASWVLLDVYEKIYEVPPTLLQLVLLNAYWIGNQKSEEMDSERIMRNFLIASDTKAGSSESEDLD